MSGPERLYDLVESRPANQSYLLTSLTALVKFLRPHSHNFFIFKLRVVIASTGCGGEVGEDKHRSTSQ